MSRAIDLARKGRFTTAPNPNVGCVIAQNGIVGEGYHARAGEPHAEVHALRAAGDAALGATAYVTLEPCSHFGRTPPCCNALVKAGVSRVVCAMVDPNPQVAGTGIRRLREAGIQVDVGLMESEAEALNPGFIKAMKTGLPYIQLKLAGSLDGRTALANGESKWITGDAARADVQVFRAQSGGILSTSSTVNADQPSLNVRWSQLPSDIQLQIAESELRQPVRVILDRANKTQPNQAVYQLPGSVIRITESGSEQAWPEAVTEIVQSEQGQSLEAILRAVCKAGVNHLWVEAGAALAGMLLQESLVDELIVYQAPKLLGQDARALTTLEGYTAMDDVPAFTLTDVVQLDQDVRLRLIPHYKKS